jgi:hypothetical protein
MRALAMVLPIISWTLSGIKSTKAREVRILSSEAWPSACSAVKLILSIEIESELIDFVLFYEFLCSLWTEFSLVGLLGLLALVDSPQELWQTALCALGSNNDRHLIGTSICGSSAIQ